MLKNHLGIFPCFKDGTWSKSEILQGTRLGKQLMNTLNRLYIAYQQRAHSEQTCQNMGFESEI